MKRALLCLVFLTLIAPVLPCAAAADGANELSLKEQIQAQDAKVRAQKEKVRIMRDKMRPEQEKLRLEREKMRVLREKARMEREVVKTQNADKKKNLVPAVSPQQTGEPPQNTP